MHSGRLLLCGTITVISDRYVSGVVSMYRRSPTLNEAAHELCEPDNGPKDFPGPGGLPRLRVDIVIIPPFGNFGGILYYKK